MRTTVKIAEDALLNARHLAHREQMPLGDSISELLWMTREQGKRSSRRGMCANGSEPGPQSTVCCST